MRGQQLSEAQITALLDPPPDQRNREKRRSLRVHQSHPRAQKRLAPLYVVRPHQVFGAETAFAETARFIKVSALIR
jgi:hypothetical protein